MNDFELQLLEKYTKEEFNIRPDINLYHWPGVSRYMKEARFAMMRYMKDHGMNPTQTGKVFDLHRSTIYYGFRKCSELCAIDGEYAKKYETICKRMAGQEVKRKNTPEYIQELKNEIQRLKAQLRAEKEYNRNLVSV